jgi:hypothetical protein
MWSVECHLTFQRNLWPPSLWLKNKPSKKLVWSSSKLAFNGLYGVISQKVELFMSTTVRTSSLTCCYVLWMLQAHDFAPWHLELKWRSSNSLIFFHLSWGLLYHIQESQWLLNFGFTVRNNNRTKYLAGVFQSRKAECGGACSTHWVYEKCIWNIS